MGLEQIMMKYDRADSEAPMDPYQAQNQVYQGEKILDLFNEYNMGPNSFEMLQHHLQHICINM